MALNDRKPIYIPSRSKPQQAAHLFSLVYKRFLEDSCGYNDQSKVVLGSERR